MKVRVILLLTWVTPTLLLACTTFERPDRRLLAFATLYSCPSVRLRTLTTHLKHQCAVECAKEGRCAAFLFSSGSCSLYSELCKSQNASLLLVRSSTQMMMIKKYYPIFRGTMYRLTDNRGPFHRVLAWCKQFGMRLWIPKDEEEMSAVEEKFDLKNAGNARKFFGPLYSAKFYELMLFIGVQDRPQGKCLTIENKPCPVTKYHLDEPSSSLEECVSYTRLVNKTLGWIDVLCSKWYYGICEGRL